MRRGALHRWSRDVFIVGHRHLERAGRYWAALLQAGPTAVLSHRTAAAVWDLRPSSRRRIEVTVVGGGRRGDANLQVHHVRSLDDQDVTTRDGLRVTTPARTLLDLADVLGPAALSRSLEQALIAHRFDADAVAATLARATGRHGAAKLEAALASLADAPPLLRSPLERRFLAFCAAHGLPQPETNVMLAGYEVDVHWRGTRLVVELDGRSAHGTPMAFERDRRRDRALTVAGYVVVRVTARQLDDDPAGLAADLAALPARSPLSPH